VHFLFSPPYWPGYNGAIEASIGYLKKVDGTTRSQARPRRPLDLGRRLARISEESPLEIVWIKSREGLQQAEIYLANELLAVVAPGAKPGWCRNTRKTGPLAKVLETKQWQKRRT
jgi:hypothetical protein